VNIVLKVREFRRCRGGLSSVIRVVKISAVGCSRERVWFHRNKMRMFDFSGPRGQEFCRIGL